MNEINEKKILLISVKFGDDGDDTGLFFLNFIKNIYIYIFLVCCHFGVSDWQQLAGNILTLIHS